MAVAGTLIITGIMFDS